MCKKRLKDQYQVKYIVVHLAIVIKIMVCSLSTPILQASVNMPRNHRNSNYNCESKRFLKQKIKGMQKLQCMCSNLQKNASKILVLYYFWQLQNSHIPLLPCITRNKELQRIIAQNGLHQSCSHSSNIPFFTNVTTKKEKGE